MIIFSCTQESDLLGMIEGDLTPLQGIHSCNNTHSIIKVTISKHTHHYKSFSKYLMYSYTQHKTYTFH